MFDISFTDFRGFRQQSYVKVRPLTILVGENSAGKSSFLAGLNYAYGLVSRYKDPSFNADPFQLGTFQQIAHFRGGRGGRAREFKIGIRGSVHVTTQKYGLQHGESRFELVATFANNDSQATISSLRITRGVDSLIISSLADGLRVDHFARKSGRTSIDFPRVYSVSRSDLVRMWPFVIREILYSLQVSGEQNNDRRLDEKVARSVSELAAIALEVSDSHHGPMQATSAIRTKPNRTYTPGAETHDGEGTHVPFEIAKLYRSRGRDKEQWSTFKNSIEGFGSSSGMFKEIAVKSFGSSTSDPFQIQFSSDGPKTNIVDLGYGTSQILPILYDITMAPQGSHFLIQQPEVHLHPKAQAALGAYFVDAFVESNKKFVIETHSDFVVDRVRNAISENRVSANDVSILFFRRTRLENKVVPIELDDMGDPIMPPDDYRSFFIGEQMKMLGV